jgi:hypothetical protein
VITQKAGVPVLLRDLGQVTYGIIRNATACWGLITIGFGGGHYAAAEK